MVGLNVFGVVLLVLFLGLSQGFGGPGSEKELDEGVFKKPEKPFIKKGHRPETHPSVNPAKTGGAASASKRKLHGTSPQQPEPIPTFFPAAPANPPPSSVKKLKQTFVDEGMMEKEAVNHLTRALQPITTLLNEGTDFLKPDWSKVFKSGKQFRALKYQEETWKTYGEAKNLKLWPAQTSWKQTVEGDLFFLKSIPEAEHDATRQYVQSRNDGLWALFFAARARHPLAEAYLLRAVKQINRDSFLMDPFPLEAVLLERALKSLKQSDPTPDVCYAVAICYRINDEACRKLMGEEQNGKEEYNGVREYNGDRAIAWLQKVGDLRCQFQIMSIQVRMATNDEPSPTAQSYIPLAQAGYAPAYSGVIELQNAQLRYENPKEPPIEDAVMDALLAQGNSQNVHKAQIEQAARFSDVQVRHDALMALGAKGLPAAYVRLGESYIGDIHDPTIKDPEKLQQALKAFTLAGQAGHPAGWRWVIRMYEQQYKEKQLTQQAWHNLLKGSAKALMRLGLNRSGRPSFDMKTKDQLETYRNPEKNAYFQRDLVRMMTDMLDEEAF